jgi:hypothetical protein
MQTAAIRVAAPLALVALCTVPATAQFEGSVSYVVGAKQTPMTQTYKGGMVRTDFSGARGSGAMIMDMNTRTMKMVMPEQKMYMSMDLNAEKMEGQGPRKPPKITDTGKTETIAGKECNIYRFAKEEGKPDTMEMCVAKGMGYFMVGRSPMGRGQGDEADMSELSANPELMKMYRDGFFPLRISKIDGANLKTTMLATKIEAKSVDASLFQVPADYQEMKMPAGMGPMPRQ